MAYGRKKAEGYRREAASCLEAAERMSAAADLARLMEMAQRWLELAEAAESEDEPQ